MRERERERERLTGTLTQILGLEQISLVHANLSTPIQEVSGVVTGKEGSGGSISTPVDNSADEGLGKTHTHTHTDTHTDTHTLYFRKFKSCCL